MRKLLLSFCIVCFLFIQFNLKAQDEPIYPNVIKTPIAFEITGRLDANPILTETEFSDVEFSMNAHRDRVLNPDIFPPDFNNMPIDPGVQSKPGWIEGQKATLQNFAGQSSGSYPPDCNGTVGASYYFQTVNTTYAIYNKTGSLIAGPSALNSIFNSSLPGASCNNGDPIVLWDEQADRWFYAEFSLCGSTDYMLIAVSQTNNPTGSWYSWSYDVDDTPDYMKFGIWQDGYYMATNTSPGNDVYVFDRATMIAGGSNPTMIGFDNSWRPSTFDGFHCILPLDNDGPWAPSGDPGQFITIVDGGQGNSADQLWIYELNANFSSPSSSTFNRVQTLGVNSFDGNFTGDWNNIPQSGTSQKLDGLSTILMFRAQYRNFSGTQRLVCAHAIAESSSEASMRWYELENTGSTWSIRQQGTYNPDNVSRWNMSIAMNGAKEIGIGYSVSNASMYPGIRYIGQSSSANAAANNTLDIAETVIQNGSYYQSTYNRWGDYANISVDPTDDHSFWFTTEYMGSSTHLTRIANFQFSSPSSPPAAQFNANTTTPASALTTVTFNDQSTGSPTYYLWSFSPTTVTYMGGTNANSSDPQIRFNNPGAYTVTLYVQNSYGNDTEIKTDYIHMGQPGMWTGATSTNWNTATNWENHMLPTSSDVVQILPSAINWPTKTGNLTLGTDCGGISMAIGYAELTVTGDLTINSGSTFYVDPTGMPNIYVGGNWTATGTFTPGQSTVVMNGSTNSLISGPSGTMNIFYDGFEGTNAWSLSGEFEVGSPIGLGGEHGNPDPSSAYLGSNVLGVDLTGLGTYPGDYENSLGDRAYQAISPIINCTGYTNVSMNFQRFLNVESPSYDHAYIDISTNNGSSWTQIYENGAAVGETAWGLQNINISSYADNQSQVRIRFCIGATDGSWLYSGWNVDEFNVIGTGSINAVFNNLAISKTNASVATNGSVDILNDFNIQAGAYFTNSLGDNLNIMGTATFFADPTGMASFIDNGTSSFANPANVELYLSDANPVAWHFISSPVAGAQSGLFTGYYLYSFDESIDSWFNIVPEDVTLNQMQGYSVKTPYNSPQHIVFNGIPNNGALSIPVTMNSTQTDQGWNLVGNPYPSSVDWDALGWTKTNIYNTIYFYSGSGGLSNYKYYVGSGGVTPGVGTNGGTNIIPPLQGFFIDASGSGTLGVGNAQRVHSNQPFYKEGQLELPQLRILAEVNGITDETVIRFYEGATAEFDGDYDAYKLFADNIPQLNSITPSGTQLSINTLNAIDENLVVPLSYNSTIDGQASFTITEMIGIEGEIYIEDLLNDEIDQVFENTVYAFDHSPMNENDRFLLHFGNPLDIEDNYFEAVHIYSEGSTVYVNNPMGIKGEISIIDMLGQEVYNNVNDQQGLSSIKLNSGTGYYLVNIQSGSNLITEKVFIR